MQKIQLSPMVRRPFVFNSVNATTPAESVGPGGLEAVFPRLWAAALLLLVAVSDRLWIPVTDFPRVPLVPWGAALPDGSSWLAAVGIVLPAVVIVASRNPRKGMWWVIAFSLFAAFLLDQHRLQPWAYQSAIYALLFAALPWHQGRRWLIVTAASVYLYSAAGKLDYQFAHTMGQEFLGAIAAPLGGLPENMSQNVRAVIALLLPAVELLIGVGWLFPITRRIAGWGAIAMHLGLIGILGPWGLDHSPGVLVWNAALIAQAWLLAVGGLRGDGAERVGVETVGAETVGARGDDPARRAGRTLGAVVARLAVIAAVLLPLGERWGFWDHWLSWALYSPHNSRVEIEIHSSVIEQLPSSARNSVEPDQDGDHWHNLALDEWSLRTLRVPVYPQARYQLALAAAVAEQAGIEREIRAAVQGISDRRTGRRETTRWLGRSELQQGLRPYWLVPEWSV